VTAPVLAPHGAGLREAAERLRRGEVVAFPTDTVYGLAALARDGAARERIYEVKGRDRSRPLIAMAAEAEGLAPLVAMTRRARWFAERWWPGPLTLVLPATQGTLGVRVPDHPVALALLREVGEPLATTSANRSGEPEAMTAAEAAALAGVGAVLDGGRAPGGVASTVLSLAGPDAEVLRDGPVATRDALLHELAFKFRTFGELETRGESALYEAVCGVVTERPDVLALMLGAQPGQRRPNLLLAAVHDLVLRGEGDALAAYYPSVGGRRAADRGAGERFCELALRRAGDVDELVRTRRVQTNEVARCAALVLALARVPGPLALIDVGASAGLNLNLDRYAYDYGAAGSLRPAGAALTVPCEARGPVEVPPAPPRVVWRRGIDLHPLDGRDPEVARWLDALIWPEHASRRERLRAALAALRRHPVEVARGDAAALLPSLAAAAPPDAALVVMHSSVMAYLSHAERARVAAAVAATGAHEVGAEGVPGAAWTYNLLTLDGRRLARVAGHGEWIEWDEEGRAGPAGTPVSVSDATPR
jgi:tRNA threonylcarbamoyl adenosine modification protein (Sua5/YciO/YrdC/YwlC family)